MKWLYLEHNPNKGENMKDKIKCSDVKPIREAMGLNHRELAEELGCTQQAVFSWEREPEDTKKGIHPMFANQLRKLKKQYLPNW